MSNLWGKVWGTRAKPTLARSGADRRGQKSYVLNAHTPFDVVSIGRRCGWRKRPLLFNNTDRFRLSNLAYPAYLYYPDRNVSGGRHAIHRHYGLSLDL